MCTMFGGRFAMFGKFQFSASAKRDVGKCRPKDLKHTMHYTLYTIHSQVKE